MNEAITRFELTPPPTTTRLRTSEEELGIDQKTLTVREVVVKYRGPGFAQRAKISKAMDAIVLIQKLLIDNSREHVVVIHLDGAHRAIGFSRFTGTANACPVHPREVLQPAILLGAAALVVAHNHPSGSCDPSQEDNNVTQKLRDACTTVGIRLLDHIILGDADCFYSYSEHGHFH